MLANMLGKGTQSEVKSVVLMVVRPRPNVHYDCVIRGSYRLSRGPSRSLKT